MVIMTAILCYAFDVRQFLCLPLLYAEGMPMMPRDRPVELAPAPWPTEKSDDLIAETARLFVVNLSAAIGDKSVRSVAKASGLNHVTVQNILLGKVWPDLATIARLEQGTKTPLWPGMIKGEFAPRIVMKDLN